jgi:hypothetical protein
MFRKTVLCATLLVLLSMPTATGDDQVNKKSVLKWLDDVGAKLASKDEQEMYSAAATIRALRLKEAFLIQWTAHSLRNSPDQQKNVVLAMMLLGELRMYEAIPLLIQHIDEPNFSRGGIGVSGPWTPLLRRMPSVHVLIQIGMPSLEPLLKKVVESDNRVIFERAALVVDGVLGPDLAPVYVAKRIEREADATKRGRLVRLQEEVAKLEALRHRRTQGDGQSQGVSP